MGLDFELSLKKGLINDILGSEGVEGAHAQNKSSKLQMFSDCYKQ